MNANDKRLLLSMMGDHDDTLSNVGCNAWKWPAFWNEAYRKEFLARVNERVNGDFKYNARYGPPDHVVWAFLTTIVKEIKDS